MEEYSSKKAEGFKVELGPPIEAPKAENNSNDAGGVFDDSIQNALKEKSKSASNFDACKQLCANRGAQALHDAKNSDSLHLTRCIVIVLLFTLHEVTLHGADIKGTPRTTNLR
ncbi:hypothetical protein ACE6H2_009785 [Prunus campanulata]